MRCAGCQREITVFLGMPRGFDWTFQPYCDRCRAGFDPGRACPACQTTFRSFLEHGFVGCETCYTALAPDLGPLVQSVRAQPATNHPPPIAPLLVLDPLARARTEKAREFTFSGPAEPVLPATIKNQGGVFRAGRTSPGTESAGIIRSVRLRMARNLVGLPYWVRLSSEQRRRLAMILLARDSRQVQFTGARALVGDEDHLRIEWVLVPGDEAGMGAWLRDRAAEIELLNRQYCWQQHRDFGFLTACPANTGSGLRLSFLVELPRLVGSGHWNRWRRELARVGYEIRGPGGEGSDPQPERGLLQISNRAWPAGIDFKREALACLTILARLEAAETRRA